MCELIALFVHKFSFQVKIKCDSTGKAIFLCCCKHNWIPEIWIQLKYGTRDFIQVKYSQLLICRKVYPSDNFFDAWQQRIPFHLIWNDKWKPNAKETSAVI